MTPPGQPTGADIVYLSKRVRRMTPAQKNVLELAEDNERCLIDGAAGTGKTVVAQELAKVRCEEGDAVGLICSNPFLSRRFERWAADLSTDSEGEVAVGTPATLPNEKHLNRVLYTGMSRANAKLILVAHESYRRTLETRRDLYDARLGLGVA